MSARTVIEAQPVYHGTRQRDLGLADLRGGRHREGAGKGVSFSRDPGVAAGFGGMFGRVLRADAEGLRLYPLSAEEQYFMRRRDGRALSTLWRDGYDGIDFADPDGAVALYNRLRNAPESAWAPYSRMRRGDRRPILPPAEREVFVFEPSLRKLKPIQESDGALPPTLYHVTYASRLGDIDAEGLLPNMPRSIGSAGYDAHARGRVFLCDARGVGLWMQRAEEFADHSSDDARGEGLVPVVLRVATSGLALSADELGERDSGAGAWFAERGIPPSALRVWNGSAWGGLASIPDRVLAACFDEDGYFARELPTAPPSLGRA